MNSSKIFEGLILTTYSLSYNNFVSVDLPVFDFPMTKIWGLFFTSIGKDSLVINLRGWALTAFSSSLEEK